MEITQHIYRLHFKSWDQWINEKMNRWEPNSITRAEYLINVIDDISAKLKHEGYEFCYDRNTMVNKFLTWAYMGDKEHFYNSCGILLVPPAVHRDLPKDRVFFIESFPDRMWMSIRKNYEDEMLFATMNGTDYFWSNLQYWAYRFIDIETSKRIKLYDEAERLQEEEQIKKLIDDGVLTYNKRGQLVDVNGSDNIDPYIADNYNNGKW